MTEIQRIVDQFNRAFEGEAWHGPSVMAILEGITAQQAAIRPLNITHSIWELVMHIAAWERAGLRRLGGDPADLSDAEDWPTVADPNEQAWQQTRKTLKEGHVALRDTFSKLDDARLDQPIVAGRAATVYGTLHGIIQHTLYHAGQIAILKKAITEGEKHERTSE